MKKNIIIIATALIIIASVVFSICYCDHEWLDATCSSPQICALCKKTQGEPLTHEWEKATCISPKKCVLCQATEGDSLGHTWKKATCVTPKTCSRCNETKGVALGHTEGKQKLQEKDYIKATATYTIKCTTCKEEIKKTEKKIESLHNGKTFIISPADFKARLSHKYYEINEDMFIRSGTTYDNKYVCGFSLDGKDLGYLFFKNNKNSITEDQKNTICFNGLQGSISGEITLELIAIIMSCDPTIEYEQAQSYAFALILGEKKEVNGIIYQFAKGSSNNGMVMVDVA